MKPDKRPNNQNKTRQEKIKQLNWKQTKDQTIKMEPDQKPIRETGGWQETKQIDWRSAGNQTDRLEVGRKPNNQNRAGHQTKQTARCKTEVHAIL